VASRCEKAPKRGLLAFGHYRPGFIEAQSHAKRGRGGAIVFPWLANQPRVASRSAWSGLHATLEVA
jgi:hypothetical protein